MKRGLYFVTTLLLLVGFITAGTLAQTSPSATAPKKQTVQRADQAEIDKLLADLSDVLKELRAIDDSDKEIARSNQLQTDTTELLDRRENKIMHEDLPDLQQRAQKHDQERARIIASGCSEKAEFVPPEVANRCNPLIRKNNAERDELMTEAQALRDQKDQVDRERLAVSATTLANAQKQKQNNARRDDLLVSKNSLEEKLLALKKTTDSCQRLLRQRGVTCEKIKLRCGMVQFDGSDPTLPASNKDSPCGK